MDSCEMPAMLIPVKLMDFHKIFAIRILAKSMGLRRVNGHTQNFCTAVSCNVDSHDVLLNSNEIPTMLIPAEFLMGFREIPGKLIPTKSMDFRKIFAIRILARNVD